MLPFTLVAGASVAFTAARGFAAVATAATAATFATFVPVSLGNECVHGSFLSLVCTHDKSFY